MTRPRKANQPTTETPFSLTEGDALAAYPSWATPSTIVSDGAYGLRLFPGDPTTVDELQDWYRPHVEAWSRAAAASTTLWFWNSEHGWATVHPLLKENGWEYVAAHIWDKGIAHVAGNVNGRTIRRFPVVTEICVLYSRVLEFPIEGGKTLEVKAWLRHEWKRAGLPLAKTNEACGVKDAATRKYFTQGWLWYFPPAPMMVRLAAYAARHGRKTERPYFSLDGRTPLTEEAWARMRYKWNHTHGISNVWRLAALRNTERVKSATDTLHANQKPLELMKRLILACTDEGDVVWEPFGGLCSASVAAVSLRRRAFAAEPISQFVKIARDRLRAAELAAEGYGQMTLGVVSG